MPAARDDVTIAEFTMDDYAGVHVLGQRGYLREDDCEPWGKELVEGGAPPCR